MADALERLGIMPTYVSYRGEVVRPSGASIDAVVGAMKGDRPHRIVSHRRPGDPVLCAPPPAHAWGWAVQVYAVRSKDSWGIGDFADLRTLGSWAARGGASVILISPLGAQPPTPHQEPCPYYSSSRRFLNLLYLRVEEIPGAERCAGELGPLHDEARALNRQRHIDHDAVFRLKLAALEIVHRAEPEPAGLRSWVSAQGQALLDYSTFTALSEIHGPAWRDWPPGLQHPGRAEVAADRRRLAGRVAFHEWVQFHLHEQLSRAAAEIQLIGDVPVGFSSDGFDSWRWQDLIAPDVRVGAPPDFFFPDGQDWGMPAFDPWKLAGVNFEPFADAIRAVASHAGGLRLDHVMSLYRLFWIPDGMSASAGVYVRYPATALFNILAAESGRSGAFVIGEDLGLVEPSVRTGMRRRRALGYRLMWFEDVPPDQWPRDSVAAIGTHDLPTVAGIWNLSEPDQRQHHLRHRLLDATHLPDGTDAVEVAVGVYMKLASAGSRIVLVSLEDALGVEERINVPGTTTEWPNWRLALPHTLDGIERAAGPARIAEVMAAAGRASNSKR
jgi:4-alpha-glucanotransferase